MSLNIYLIILTLVLVNANKNEFTNKDLKHFYDWWQETEDVLYKEAVLQCSNNNRHENVAFKGNGFKVVTEASCSDMEARAFKVTKTENAVLLDLMEEGERCFKSSSLFRQQMVKLEGNLDGYVRAEYDGGLTLHAMVKEGVLHGPAIMADNAGLVSFAFRYNGETLGGEWTRMGENIIFSNKRVLSYSDQRAIVLTKDGRVFSGKFLAKQGILSDASNEQDRFRLNSECLLDVNDDVYGRDRTDLTFALAEGRMDSNERLLETCNDFGGDKTGYETLNWINNTYFSLQRDTLDYFSPLLDEISDEAIPLFSNLAMVDKSSGQYTADFNGRTVRVQLAATHIDENGVPHGYGKMTLLEEAPTVKGGWFTPTFFDGNFEEGAFEGALLIGTSDGRFINARVTKNVMHGMAVGLGLRHLSTLEGELVKQEGFGTPGTGMLAVFKNGRAVGKVWVGLVGGGFIHGKVNDDGELSGDGIVFIYPDGETALLGRFENGVMRSAKEAEVIGVTCEKHGIPVAELKASPNSPTFAYDPSNNETFGDFPLLRDPLDGKNVVVRSSAIPSSGEGVFALKRIKSGATACYFSAMRYKKHEYLMHEKACHQNKTLSNEERRACTKYTVGLETTDGKLDIPPWMDDGRYSATSGHKVNCAVGEEANALFMEAEHPRFGLVLAVVARVDIDEGQEVLVDYGYKEAPFPSDHLWYHEAKRKAQTMQERDKEL